MDAGQKLCKERQQDLTPREDVTNELPAQKRSTALAQAVEECSLDVYTNKIKMASMFLRHLLSDGFKPDMPTYRFKNYTFQDWWITLYHYASGLNENSLPEETEYILSVMNYIVKIQRHRGCAISRLLSDYEVSNAMCAVEEILRFNLIQIYREEPNATRIVEKIFQFNLRKQF